MHVKAFMTTHLKAAICLTFKHPEVIFRSGLRRGTGDGRRKYLGTSTVIVIIIRQARGFKRDMMSPQEGK